MGYALVICVCTWLDCALLMIVLWCASLFVGCYIVGFEPYDLICLGLIVVVFAWLGLDC